MDKSIQSRIDVKGLADVLAGASLMEKESFQKQKVDLLRQTIALKKQLEELDHRLKVVKDEKVLREIVQKEASQVAKLPLVEATKIGDRALMFKTELLKRFEHQVKSPKTIGAFKIRLDFQEGAEMLRALNIFQRTDDLYDHPAIMNTEFCLGSISDDVKMLYREKRVFDLLDLLIDFLKNCKDDGDNFSPHISWEAFFKRAKQLTEEPKAPGFNGEANPRINDYIVERQIIVNDGENFIAIDPSIDLDGIEPPTANPQNETTDGGWQHIIAQYTTTASTPSEPAIPSGVQWHRNSRLTIGSLE